MRKQFPFEDVLYSISATDTYVWPQSGLTVPTTEGWWSVDPVEPNGSGFCTAVWHDVMYDVSCQGYAHGPSNVKCVVLAAACGQCPSGPEAAFMFGSS